MDDLVDLFKKAKQKHDGKKISVTVNTIPKDR